jgi:PKD repeat protein
MAMVRSHVRLLVLLILVGALPASGQNCADDLSCGFNTCRAPVTPAPPVLWGDLRPAESQIPEERDSTDYDRRTSFDARNPYFMAIDMSNGYLFTAIHTGFQIWDARGNPASPVLLSQRDGRAGGFPSFPVNPEEKFPVQDIAVPEGRDDLAVVVSAGGAGFSIWDTSSKTIPRALYQDSEKSGAAAHATMVGSTALGFMGSEGNGLLMYDLSRARANNTTCVEQSPASNCNGVYLGKLGSRANATYVHGRNQFVAFSTGAVQRGLEIWNVSDRFSPFQVVSALSTTIVYGVAMWNQGSTWYLATREEPGPRLRIYDVSCITSNTCGSGIGSPIADVALSDPGNSRYLLTFSRSGSTPYLHLGSDRSCSGYERREWLFDVSIPFQPRDITPPGGFINGTSTGYWNWYARNTRTGFNFAGQREARFNGEYLYRAAFSYFDIHRKISGNQLGAFFTFSPNEIYPGTPVNFEDASTGNPNSWLWTFPDGSPSSSSARNPQVTFSSAGPKNVSLQACGTTCDTAIRTVNVLSPGADVAGVSVSPQSVTSCQTVSFSATGVTGQQPISYSWTIRAPGGAVVGSCFSNPCTWAPVPSNASGNYVATVTVSNASNPGGSSASSSVAVTATSLGFTSSTGAPTADPFTGATVRFRANSTGASEWSWDFDDDGNPSTTNFTAFTSDPSTGPNPTHIYATSGNKTVRARIRDCAGSSLESNPLTISVNTAGALVAGFQALGCPFGICSFAAGQSITFTDASQGSPESWAYDWNNTGTSQAACVFGAPSSFPQTSHLYTTPGQYRPCLRVTRGTQSDISIHSRINITQSSGPVITITGPSSGLINQQLSFGATAVNCTASGSWTWNVAGGNGSSSSNTIQLSWSTPGTKQITVTNSGCAGAQGSANVVITNPTGAPLDAAFTVSSANPFAGMVLTFDASSSGGSPTGFTWNMGDNSALRDGAVIQHTFSTAGTYNVTLTVARPGSGAGCTLGYCTDMETKTIVVQAGGGCPDTPSGLCLGENGRFKVETTWRTPAGATGSGSPVRLTSDSGYFWFFNPANVEMVVKALDGCDINQRSWFFAAGLTNVEVTTVLTDTVTGATKTYTNLQGEAFQPVQDVNAFFCYAKMALNQEPASSPVAPSVDNRAIDSNAVCQSSATDLCLNDGKFRVNASWRTPNGTTGQAQAVQLTGDSGYFWFFNSANVEMVVKALNACGVNQRNWFFAAGLTNVEVTTTVTDTTTGESRVYTNSQGNAFQPVQDVEAFACN